LINQYINVFETLSGQLGAPEVVTMAQKVKAAVNAQLDMLKVAASSKKPSQDVLQKLVKPTNDLMTQISEFRDSNRSSKFFNHLSTVSEGIPALGWVVVSPTPGPYVADTRGASEFYSNRILKDYKGKEQVHVDWVAAYNNFLKELQAYIKQYHTTGLEWNAKGGDASSSNVSSSQSSGGPPPPPSAPAVYYGESTSTSSSSSGKKTVDNNALFAALNKGTDISKGLNKVTNDMKAKNQKDKPALTPQHPKSTSAPKTTKQENTKPPKLVLEGSKWAIENQNGNKDIVISETEPKQTCYLYKCTNTVVQVKGKINAIVIDSCNKTAVVFESVVASVDIVNCNSVEVQVKGKVPAISIDKTSGCQVYLSKEALATEIYSSKSSEMNVSIPGANDDSDLVEMPIPEQYRTLVKNGKLHTECSSHV